MKYILTITLTLFMFNSFSQDTGLVEKLDELRNRWDAKAEEMKTFEGLAQYCKQSDFRIELTTMLNDIHHYDSVLFKTVKEKFNLSKDKEAKATIEDIEKLEMDYKTRSFQKFLRKECAQYNEAEQNKAFGEYEQDRKRIEKELAAYIKEITRQIDLVDEHAHHLMDQ
jgi:hypothetical protein